MGKCAALNKKGNQCGRPVSSSGKKDDHNKCYIHNKPTQTERETMYKKELKKLHERVRFYNQKCAEFHAKIDLIQRVDWIKSELMRIGGSNRPFKYIVRDWKLKAELEELFNFPFHQIVAVYHKMLDDRNAICHKFTRLGWGES